MIKYFLEGDAALERADDGASGYDLRALNTGRLEPSERQLIPTGLFIEMPRGVEAQVRSRSGLSAKNGVIVLNAPGTIDSSYRGEVKVLLFNASQTDFDWSRGDRIAQLVFAPVLVPGWLSWMDTTKGLPLTRMPSLSDLSDTTRATGGFGSTGLKMRMK